MNTRAPQQKENVMLLTEYKDSFEKITFPAVVQQKIDGYRCVYIAGKFYSRSGVEFKHPSLAPIAEALANVPSGVAIDGELQHIDGTYLSTGKLFGDNEDRFVFHVFDCFTVDRKCTLTYTERYNAVKQLVGNVQELFGETDLIRVVENAVVSNHEDIHNWITAALEAGHEGIVIKNMAGKYTFSRSTDVQKLKTL